MEKHIYWILIVTAFASVSINLKVFISAVNPVSDAAANPALSSLERLSDSQMAARPKNGLRPFTVDDFLKREDVGTGASDPMGRWFVWEQSPPYDELHDYGVGILGAWQGGNFRLMHFDFALGKAAPLFPADPSAAYRLGEFSPDGRYVTFVKTNAERVCLGVFDFKLRNVREFDLAPRLAQRGETDAVWVSADRLVVSSFPEGQGAEQVTFRRLVAKKLISQWTTAWAGTGTSVVAVESHVEDKPLPLDGKLLELNLRSGEVRTLSDGQYESLSLSHDGHFVAALRQYTRAQTPITQPDTDWKSNRSVVEIFDLTNDAALILQVPELEALPNSLEWASNSPRLAFFGWGRGASLRTGTYHVADVTTRKVVSVPHRGLDLVSQRERGGPQHPEPAVWIGDHLAVFARGNSASDEVPRFTYTSDRNYMHLKSPERESGGRNANWYQLSTNRRPVNLTSMLTNVSAVPLYATSSNLLVLADGHVWRVGPGRTPKIAVQENLGPLSNITDQLVPKQRRRWPKTLVLRSRRSEPGLVLVDAASGSAYSMRLQGGSEPIGFSDTRGDVLLSTGVGKRSGVAVVDAQGSVKYVEHLNENLKDVAETQWSSFRYRSDDSRSSKDLEGCLLLPFDFRAGHRYPMIVDVYPGRGGGCADPALERTFALGATANPFTEHLLAARGFIVFRPDMRANFSESDNGSLNGLSNLVNKGIDSVLACGCVDHGRVGLIGFSQGGFASLWLATQSDRFGAVVSLNGWSDMYSHYFEPNNLQEFEPNVVPNWGSAERYESASGTYFSIGATPWMKPENYIRNSPLFLAPKISAPVLLINSDWDVFRVDQYQMMFAALYRLQKEARLLTYRGEGHGLSSPPNIRHMWSGIFEWFDRFLKIARDADGNMLLDDTHAKTKS